MAFVPGQLIWEIVKKNNSFLVKEFGRSHDGVRFSKEPNNLLNLHSYKQSGLANKKTVTIGDFLTSSSVDMSSRASRSTPLKLNFLNVLFFGTPAAATSVSTSA